ncbi:MAG: alkaline phosphatase family protein [Pyrinomonadaceae bacterium]
MTRINGSPVLAIGIDSAEPSLVRRMIEQQELPRLKSLLAEGKWINIQSPTRIGTTSIWPTFMTGEDPEVHGIYSESCWEPTTMSLSPFTGRQLDPFWKELVHAGNTVGVMAVPFMPFVGLSDGFEVSEAAPYLQIDNSHHSVSAPDLITRETARNALSHGHINVSGPDDYNNLKYLASDSFQGVGLRGDLAERLLKHTRPDLSIIVFTETHESAHCLWQTVEPEHSLYNEDIFKQFGSIKPTLKDIYQEVDRQIGRLIDVVGKDATVLVFSLHGMQPALAVPAFLSAVLCELGFSRLAEGKDLSWSERAVGLMRALKRRTPDGLKKFYYKALPRETVVRWAQTTLLPTYDWSQTRAFSLVNEQHGSIRINLIGREASGIVPVEEYEETCRQVEKALRSLRTEDGKPLVRDVIRTAQSAAQAIKQRLPDLVVPWEIVAFRSPVRIEGSAGEFFPEGRRYLGQHTPEGFCILKSSHDCEVGDVLPSRDLGRLMTSMVRDGSQSKIDKRLAACGN